MSNSVLSVSIIIALLIIAALAWRYWRQQRRRRIKMAERSEPDLYTDRYFDEPTLDANDPPENLLEEPPLVDNVVEPPTLTEPIAETTTKPEVTTTQIPLSDELIVVLYVVTQQEPGFLGTDIFTVLEDLGLRYGDMRIFHHYGVGELKVKKPVFSIANMLEPGIFDPQKMTEFASPGLALFMRLPGPFGGRIAFELMLTSAKKIAEVLEGILQDEDHLPLEPNKISQLREKIAHFEQRNVSLAMTKRFN